MSKFLMLKKMDLAISKQVAKSIAEKVLGGFF